MTTRIFTVLLLGTLSSGCIKSYSLDDDAGTRAADRGALDDPADTPGWVELVGSGRQQFGEALAFADLDGDGLDDIILANRSNSDGHVPYRGGSVVILYGRRDRLAGTFPLDDADAEIVGPEHETSGLFLATGDFDGDGFDDVAVSVTDVGPSHEGTLHVIHGARERLHGTVLIESIAPALGGIRPVRVASAGDLDRDGCDDLLVGGGGAARIVRGRRERWIGAVSPAATISGSYFTGWSLSGAGDLDGDGAPDIVVGDDARIGVFYGPDLFRDRSLDDADARITIARVEWYGVSAGFDLDGDGLSDLVVPGSGAVQVFYGSRVQWTGSLGPDDASVVLTGVQADERPGASTSAGDADGDGRDDLLIGAPNHGDENAPQGLIGRVYRVHGAVAGGSLEHADGIWDGRVMPAPDYPGPRGPDSYGEMLGLAVAQDGDFDGDGLADALLGAPGNLVPYGGRIVRLVYGARR